MKIIISEKQKLLLILHEALKDKDQNIDGGDLQICSENPLTGFYRDGFCRTGKNDTGSHTVCAKVTQEFLDFTETVGNYLRLNVGDRWCLCASRWKQAFDVGLAPPVILSSTNVVALSYLSMKDLSIQALDSIKMSL